MILGLSDDFDQAIGNNRMGETGYLTCGMSLLVERLFVEYYSWSSYEYKTTDYISINNTLDQETNSTSLTGFLIIIQNLVSPQRISSTTRLEIHPLL